MLGYCGINCDDCGAYNGTLKTDLARLEKVAGNFSEGAFSAKDWVCLGCVPADQAFLARYCAGCGIRACAIGRGIQNCAACPDFEGCEQLHEFIKNEAEEIVQRMKLLRECFLSSQQQA